jgi:hypothetical protein
MTAATMEECLNTATTILMVRNTQNEDVEDEEE